MMMQKMTELSMPTTKQNKNHTQKIRKKFRILLSELYVCLCETNEL